MLTRNRQNPVNTLPLFSHHTKRDINCEVESCQDFSLKISIKRKSKKQVKKLKKKNRKLFKVFLLMFEFFGTVSI
jgi:hypothetical protein